MINLLPPEEKQKLISRKEEKLTLIFGFIILVSLACLILVLLSIKFYILAAADEQKNILAQTEQEYQTPEFKDLNSTAQRYNGVLAQVDSFYKKEVYFNQALDIITGVSAPKGLYLINFFLSRDDKGVVQVSVSGNCDTRDNLLIFKGNIEKDREISNSYFSPESWISPKNVNFSLTFEISQNEKQ